MSSNSSYSEVRSYALSGETNSLSNIDEENFKDDYQKLPGISFSFWLNSKL